MKETKNSYLNMDGEHFTLSLGIVDGVDNTILFDNLSLAYMYNNLSLAYIQYIEKEKICNIYDVILSKCITDITGNYPHDKITFKDGYMVMGEKNRFKINDINDMKVFVSNTDFSIVINSHKLYEKLSKILFDKELYMSYTTNGVTFMNRYSAQMIDNRSDLRL